MKTPTPNEVRAGVPEARGNDTTSPFFNLLHCA
jgi:hypothetical protein